jgi:TRAP-type C4-dicarboxylate transport system permease small subunit
MSARFAAALDRTAAALERTVATLLALLLTAMVLTVTWQVFTREILEDPSGWTEELARFLLIWIGLFGGALAYRRGLHLGLDLPAGALKFLGPGVRPACVLLFAVTVLVGGGTSLVVLTTELDQFSPALGLPMAVVYLALPLSGLFMAAFALAALAKPESAGASCETSA